MVHLSRTEPTGTVFHGLLAITWSLSQEIFCEVYVILHKRVDPVPLVTLVLPFCLYNPLPLLGLTLFFPFLFSSLGARLVEYQSPLRPNH